MSGSLKASPPPFMCLEIETMKKRMLLEALAITAGNRAHAAKMLGISVRTVRNWIKTYDLPRGKAAYKRMEASIGVEIGNAIKEGCTE
jgi:DNA-binding NtrC family response regulator